MSGHLRLPKAVNRVDQSGIIVVPTCHVNFWMATPNIHHSVQALTRSMDHMALQWLTIFGFTLMEDDPPILHITAGLATLKRCDTVSLGQNNWPIFYSTWLCNRFASMVSAWLGICKVSCYTYMNVSNNCHSAKTTGELSVTNGFTMIADDGMTLSSRL